jgi:hypothetical protein
VQTCERDGCGTGFEPRVAANGIVKRFCSKRCKTAASVVRWGERNPERRLYQKRTHALKRFGLTVEQWDAMLVAQSGRCGVCASPMTGPNEPAVDHDHKTGAVRSLLCMFCNSRLAVAEDETFMAAARAYLEKHRE